MFINNPKFLDEERSAPILDRNNDYLQPEIAQRIIERTKDWPKLVPSSSSFKVLSDVPPTPSERIIKHDAERIYLNEERRKSLVRISSCYENQFADYHQGLSLVCGFLLISLREQEVADIVSAIATNPKYIPQYWCAESVAGARDAYVWEYLLQHHFPEIAAHLKKRSVLPETFCQKWFIALTINVLPFKALYSFIENFLKQGYVYLFKFGLTLVSTCKTFILAGQDYEIFQILRYDKELPEAYGISDDTMCDIVERAATFNLGNFDFAPIRVRISKEIIEPRLQRAKEAAAAAEAESRESSNENSSEEGTSCDICDENVPDMWCHGCKKMVCEACHTKSAGGHAKSHKVDEDWQKYENNNDED